MWIRHASIALLAFLALTALLIMAVLARPVSSLPSTEQCLNAALLGQMPKYPANTPLLSAREAETSVGTTRDVHYLGQTFWRADPGGRVSCLGLMFEALLGACEDWALTHGDGPLFHVGHVDAYGFRSFRRDFYQGISGGQGGRSMVDALENWGAGVEVMDPDMARPGDLVQLSRNHGGSHAALFLGWEYDGQDRRVALHYWGAQRGRVGEAVEFIGPRHDDLNANRIYIVRAFLPSFPQQR